MRPLIVLSISLALIACNPPKNESLKPAEAPKADAPPAAIVEVTPRTDATHSVVRINSTKQSWNVGQPWEKNEPRKRRALGAIVGPKQVLTTAEMVADATYLEFESTNGNQFAQAKVIAVDYEANLALLGPLNEKEGEALFKDTKPLIVTAPPKIGQTLEILQVEDNNLPLLTPGTLQSVTIASTFLPSYSFLTYLVKASMQSAASSFSLPVLQDGKLAGILTSYNSKDQICDVASTDIIARFLKEASTGTYKGFPSLGVSIARTEDPSFRQWLKLTEDQGGIYISKVRQGGAAEMAGIKVGDVLLALDGQKIDRRGYYEHSNYGSLFGAHMIRGEKFTGDIVTLSLLRDGQPLEIKATLTREDEKSQIVPIYQFDRAPNYLIKGGLVFQELSRPLLEAYGDEWTSRAPLSFLDALENPDQVVGKVERIVFLSGAIPTPATIGYEGLRNLTISKVNGKPVKNMKSLISAFESHMGEIHSIEFAEEQYAINLDEAISSEVDSGLLKRGIPRLSRAN